MICRELCHRHACKTCSGAGKQAFQVVVKLFDVTVILETRAAAGHQFRGMQHKFNMAPTFSGCQAEKATYAGAVASVGAEPMRDGQEAVDDARPEARV